ncbi:MAG: hypothetical protein WC926_00370 [Candidatus Paceibacterota bacterium]|jgi:hypothetical protein
MAKITFNEDLFSLVPSPEDPGVAFVFNKKDGSIFQIEGVTKEIITGLKGKKKEEESLVDAYIAKYKMGAKDVKSFRSFLAKVKKARVIIN